MTANKATRTKVKWQQDSKLLPYLKTQLNDKNNSNNFPSEENEKELLEKGWNVISDVWYINENDIHKLESFNDMQKIKLNIIVHYFRMSIAEVGVGMTTNLNDSLPEMQLYLRRNRDRVTKEKEEEEEELLPLYNVSGINESTEIASRKKAATNANRATTRHKLGSIPTVYFNPNKNKNKKRNKPSHGSSLIWWLVLAILFCIYKHYKFFHDNYHSYKTASSTSSSQQPQRIQNRKIAFIHIGKTGGSTAATMIRNKCFRTTPSQCDAYTKENMEEQLAKIGAYETDISLQVHSYFHIRKVQARKYTSFIVTVRHPVERMISWYNHFHPKNRLVWFRRRPFFDCYPNLNDMATIGLSPDHAATTADTTCSNIAIDCTLGQHVISQGYNSQPNKRLKECEHMYYNYKFYTHDLLQLRNKEIFILRTEQFWDDWRTINIMLGGSEQIHKVHEVSHSEGKQLLVTNRTISMEGMQNVCRVLCSEIQLYKQLIWRGVNLDIEDKKISLKELEKTCPIQADIDECP